MKPIKILLFLLITGLILAPLTFLIPKKGIEIAGFNLKMLRWEKLLGQDSIHHADISNILDAANQLDSLPDILEAGQNAKATEGDSSTKTVKFPTVEELGKNVYRLNYNELGKQNLNFFFELLKSGAQQKRIVRVLHYGDSQIEGDRITSFLREKLQSRFGGFGPGVLPAIQPYESYFSISQTNTGNWFRFTTFGKKDPRVPHNRYGVLAAFSRFAPLWPDSIPFKDSTLYAASITFNESKPAYSTVRSFNQIAIHYGYSHRKTTIRIFNQNNELIHTDSLKAGMETYVYRYRLPELSKNLRIEFEGYDSPDIYTVDLNGSVGVSFDNIGMRGSSGTFFTTMNSSQLKLMYDRLNVDMFILQFGGNVMPYIKDSASVESYGRWMGSQLYLLKKLMPQATIVVVGPSDMSYKEGENFVTYPFLPYVREKLKEATIKAGYSYWDMYEAMGGLNSMPEWVKADPPLAGIDHTHFTPKGARLIANMLYNAIMIELAENQNQTKKDGK